MILSESEKNRIRGLYGLLTEADASAPPPDESVLVAKKNPFNLPKEIYDKILTEYDIITGSALLGVEKGVGFRKYNEKLKDGEYFLKYDRDCFVDFIWGEIKPVLDSLKGKSVRGSKDNFLYFKEVNDLQKHLIINNLFEVSPNSVYAPTILTFYLKDDEGRTLHYTYLPERDSFKDPYGRELSPESNDKLLKFLSDKLKPLLDIKKLPNNCFEIREIKRKETDF
jgi:hypothetical protein